MKLRALCAGLVGLATLLPGAPTQAQAPGQLGCDPAVSGARGSAAALVSADNQLGFRLFSRLFLHPAQDNVFLSPASAALALQMTYDGARGSTQRGMADALGLGVMPQQQVRLNAAALLTELRSSDSHVQLGIASSLWGRIGVRFQQAFLQHVRASYGARITALDFASPSAPATINSWVSCATQGKIKTIVDRIPASAVMYLINAVYFHGEWKSPFDPKLTQQRPFTTGDGRQESLPLMKQHLTVPFYQGPDFQVASLPYGTNGRFRMDLVLPRRGISLQQFRGRLSSASWESWISSLHPASLDIALPRFSLTNDFTLNRPLIDLGMGTAFSRQADLSGICAVQRCQISDVRQKTYLAVNEKGTTAAAATSVGVVATVCCPPSMVVDHPFYLAIRDTRTGALLFLGAVNDPLKRG